MKIKGIIIGIFVLIILLISILVLGIFLVQKPHFKISLNENEVNEMVVCCLNKETINQFEEPINNFNESGSTIIIQIPNYRYCLPTEENSKYFEVPCESLKKEDLTIEWLEWNAECVELRCNEEYPIEQIDYSKEDKFCCFHKDTIGKGICGVSLCSKYKFGEYAIESFGKTK